MTDTLLDAVDKLTIEHPYPAIIEGRTRWVRRDPLIRLLREAIASSLTGGNGLASAASKIPFDADALQQYDLLEGLILEQLRTVTDATPHLTPEANLRAWYAAFMVTADEHDIELWHDVWHGWETKIEAKLSPPVILELIDTTTKKPYPCPECGFDWYEQILNSGPNGKRGRWYDREKRIALTATYRPDGNGGLEQCAVECGCCNWRATGSAGVRGFAWDLENPPEHDTPTNHTVVIPM
ncbi:hypothetical protein FB562_2210 [Homoserinimonas aerilata]|uniref:Uncharacterized protein n=1 Tax=Homoserinimonas aerilata TaxID=1162970 RepID=A0A542YF13_9MICO|nr:hypothetical protein [Homoserinimonas aerilata]TQL46686.1 hypothetical protein FB562_2210 [Homoserinimonas aerilata]